MAIEFNLGVIADNAHVDASGKLYILGEFRYIFASTFPARHGRMSVVARWIANVPDVRDGAQVEVEIVDADGKAIVPRSPKMPLKFAPIGPADRGKVQAQLVMQLDGLILPAEGSYSLHWFVNGTSNGQVTFHVVPSPKGRE